ncbi:MAG: pirin family protein, partial [Comamonas sp.]
GFETVTIVFQGEVSHRDSHGAGGTIGPDEVQWMTAASGLLHEEFHSEAFAQRGGTLEMVQLWVNLPARFKMQAPRYQALTRNHIPSVPLPHQAGLVRVIAGDYNGQAGAAMTYSPMNVWDVRLHAQGEAHLELPEGHTLMLMVVRGVVQINGQTARAGQWLQMSREGVGVNLQADADAIVLVLGGEPIHEPIAGQGPFVMNTREELAQAFGDFYAGRMGQMAPTH